MIVGLCVCVDSDILTYQYLNLRQIIVHIGQIRPWCSNSVQDLDPESGSRMNIPDHISYFLGADTDPAFGIFFTLDQGRKYSYLGSGINIPDSQHCYLIPLFNP